MEAGVTIANTETRLVPIESLKPHPDNPRVGNVDVITESIRKSGFYGSVIVRDGTNVILAGTHRWKAAQAAGLTEIPVTFVKTDAKGAKRILLADNRTSDLGVYDDSALAELLGSLGDLEGTGWGDGDLESLRFSMNPPNLDNLAAAYDPAATSLPERPIELRLVLTPPILEAWTLYVGDEDATEAFGRLLGF